MPIRCLVMVQASDRRTDACETREAHYDVSEASFETDLALASCR